MITLKYDIEKINIKVGTIEWTDGDWKYETQDDEIRSELDAIRKEGKVTGYKSETKEEGDALVTYDFIPVDIFPDNSNFVEAVGHSLDRRLEDDVIYYDVSRTAIIEDGVKIGE